MEHKMKMKSFLTVLFFGFNALAVNFPVYAEDPPEDTEALNGLHEVKVIFDITTGDAKKLLSRLGLIEETRDGMLKQGITPHNVLAFRGPASLFIQKDQGRGGGGGGGRGGGGRRGRGGGGGGESGS